MAEGSLITDRLRNIVGVPGEPTIFKVEEGAIKRYAEAIGDPNPLYNDIEYARESKYGRLICPGGFPGYPIKGRLPVHKVNETLWEAGAPLGLLDGGIEFEFLGPIGAGDVLVATAKIIDQTERETKSGKMMFSVAETTYINQNDDVVLKRRQTHINH